MSEQPIRLYMFQTGVLKCKENNIKMNASLEPYEIPVPWYLITHPKGNVIIDGGNAVECATDPVGHWGGITQIYWPEMTEAEGCENALASLGISKESIRYVLQSHLHLDHTGAIGRFPNATHIVQRAEYDYAYTADWFAAGGYIKKDFDKPGLKWHFLNGEVNDEFDLYGDGVIKMIFTPGHSPGHTSFLITLPETGSLVLAVDASYTLDHWNDKALPGFLASAIDSVRSVAKLRYIAERYDALVVTGHDPDAWPSFKKAPEFYS
ncbi:Glyoxylase, beta-lactamase superfamily II [Flexibacter flexilis DSM 6793]|uniref:Glyoxylase, beta-lactamase superfamily II n=1 Tax=Flexibacter flexilis DSM 6793 TaxID=927664 RepID=A0A1I1DEC7_9BACT|nr:N-acyl homoserine lactonase family protein [Flexibacter flexilis]SFB72736.1 Glyoxylase, beta-lactamase superfamily II [Flexibacter flexilis DSM 6793]